jgi:hypothetical protein
MMRKPWTIAVIFAVALALAGTGSATRQTSKNDSLTIAISAPNTNFAPVFVAKAAGLFSKYGLDVNIMENTGASTLNLIVSGQADLTLFTPPNEILLALQGQPTTLIMNGLRDSGSALISNSSITSLSQIKGLGSSCSIATTAPGTQGYGYATQYTKIPSLGMSQCQVSGASSNAIAFARLTSNQSQLAVLPLSYAITVVNPVGAHILISPNVPSYRKTYDLPNFMSSGYWGLSSNINSKPDVMVRFIKAIIDANKLLVPANLTKLATYLQGFSSFNTLSIPTLRTSLQFIISYMGPGSSYASKADMKLYPNRLSTNPGYVPKSIWDESLKQWAKWGVANFDPTAPASQYGQRVNMLYLSKALGSRK